MIEPPFNKAPVEEFLVTAVRESRMLAPGFEESPFWLLLTTELRTITSTATPSEDRTSMPLALLLEATLSSILALNPEALPWIKIPFWLLFAMTLVIVTLPVPVTLMPLALLLEATLSSILTLIPPLEPEIEIPFWLLVAVTLVIVTLPMPPTLMSAV